MFPALLARQTLPGPGLTVDQYPGLSSWPAVIAIARHGLRPGVELAYFVGEVDA